MTEAALQLLVVFSIASFTNCVFDDVSKDLALLWHVDRKWREARATLGRLPEEGLGALSQSFQHLRERNGEASPRDLMQVDYVALGETDRHDPPHRVLQPLDREWLTLAFGLLRRRQDSSDREDSLAELHPHRRMCRLVSGEPLREDRIDAQRRFLGDLGSDDIRVQLDDVAGDRKAQDVEAGVFGALLLEVSSGELVPFQPRGLQGRLGELSRRDRTLPLLEQISSEVLTQSLRTFRDSCGSAPELKGSEERIRRQAAG